jgi:hypothetical protein
MIETGNGYQLFWKAFLVMVVLPLITTVTLAWIVTHNPITTLLCLIVHFKLLNDSMRDIYERNK